jgi:hypothetical protein
MIQLSRQWNQWRIFKPIEHMKTNPFNVKMRARKGSS